MRLLLSAILALSLLSCGGDDDGPAFDSGPVCTLPAAVITCTGEGDDAPCTAVCADAYCHVYGQLPEPVCTENCSTVADCADGWECNDMGRCRPPDP